MSDMFNMTVPLLPLRKTWCYVSGLGDNVDFSIVQMKESEGHRVMFIPLHYSNLQLIELLWARIKGALARKSKKTPHWKKYAKDSRISWTNWTLKEMDYVGAIIDHVDRAIEKFMREISAEGSTSWQIGDRIRFRVRRGFNFKCKL